VTPVLSEAQRLLLGTVGRLMDWFGPDYWRDLDDREAYPEAFVSEFEAQGFGSLLIPEAYGGTGGSLTDAALVLEEIHARGGNAQPFHGQYYLSFLMNRFASEDLRRTYLPALARGELRMQSFALTEPDAGSDLTRITTTAERIGDRYRIRGRKVFISRVEQSDLMVLVARTAVPEKEAKRTEGLSLFLIDLREAKGIDRTRIETMFNSQTYELFLNDVEVPAGNRFGEENRGFEYLLHVLNPERILLASECIGDSRWFIDRSTEYAKGRVVFGRPIGSNQGVQFPLADAYARMAAADLVRWHAVHLHESDADPKEVGKYANIAKYLASEGSWRAANVAMDIHGGYGMARSLHVERKMRETRLYQVAPVSNNLVLAHIAHQVLGLPRSY
jgi:acyl-CoA dehydrogenase